MSVQSRARLSFYPALNRHEVATAQGEAIQLRWENEMKQAADELQAILNAKSDDDGECVAHQKAPVPAVTIPSGTREAKSRCYQSHADGSFRWWPASCPIRLE